MSVAGWMWPSISRCNFWQALNFRTMLPFRSTFMIQVVQSACTPISHAPQLHDFSKTPKIQQKLSFFRKGTPKIQQSYFFRKGTPKIFRPFHAPQSEYYPHIVLLSNSRILNSRDQQGHVRTAEVRGPFQEQHQFSATQLVRLVTRLDMQAPMAHALSSLSMRFQMETPDDSPPRYCIVVLTVVYGEFSVGSLMSTVSSQTLAA